MIASEQPATKFWQYNFIWLIFVLAFAVLTTLMMTFSAFLEASGLTTALFFITLASLWAAAMISAQMIKIYTIVFSLVRFETEMGMHVDFREFLKLFSYCSTTNPAQIKLELTDGKGVWFGTWNGFDDWIIAYPNGSFKQAANYKHNNRSKNR